MFRLSNFEKDVRKDTDFIYFTCNLVKISCFWDKTAGIFLVFIVYLGKHVLRIIKYIEIEFKAYLLHK